MTATPHINERSAFETKHTECLAAFHALPYAAYLIKSLTCFSQASLSCAASCHEPETCWSANLRRSSSQRNQRVLCGLLARTYAGMSFSVICHAESLQMAERWAKRSPLIRSTCPAQHHLLRRCDSTQNRMPAFFAACRASLVDLLTQSTHCSSGFLRGPAIRLSILF